MAAVALYVLVHLLFVLECLLKVRWTPSYFRFGIPVYTGTTATAPRTAVELYFGGDGKRWPGWADLAFERVSFDELLFRERWFRPLHVFIHGRILEESDGRQRIVVYSDAWLPLAFVALGLFSVTEGMPELVAIFAVAAIALPLLQRLRAQRIRRTIEEAA